MSDNEPQPPADEGDARHRYWAFISYSHRDKPWADWLHKRLETYRVPRAMVGRETRSGRVPARLFPIFRDVDELPTSSDLGAAIRTALEQSRYLIVICSPRSARSRWVNEEVLVLKRMGRADRLLCLIVDGEPNASDNLNTHDYASLYAAFPPAEARRLMDRLELVHTPKHGSWLNIAEIELNVLSRQCFCGVIGDAALLREQVAAWESERNVKQKGVDWQFTTVDARIKLKRLYPKIQA